MKQIDQDHGGDLLGDELLVLTQMLNLDLVVEVAPPVLDIPTYI
jgi:hypothetical protein